MAKDKKKVPQVEFTDAERKEAGIDPKPAPRPTVREEKKIDLKCELTREELLEAGAKMADAAQRIAELESALASYKAQNKSEMEVEKAQTERLSDKIRRKYEYRPIKCLVEKDYQAGRVTVFRTDTGDVIEARPMTDDELSRLPM